MLSQNTIDSLAVNNGIAADVLAKAISNEEEVKLEIPEGRFLTTENESKLIDNHGKKKYDEGKSKNTKEILENIKTSYNLEGENIEDLISNFKINVLKDVNAEPNEKLIEKEKAINALRESLISKESEIEKILNEKASSERRSKAISDMPQLREDLGINKSEAYSIIFNNVEVKEDGIYKNDQLLTDSLQSPVKMVDFLKNETNQRGWNKKSITGNGGNSLLSTGANPKTYTEFVAFCESKQWSESSLQAREYLKKIKAETDNFDMNN